MARQAQGALNEPRLIEETGLAARVARLTEPILENLGYRLVRVKLSALAGMTVQVMAERPDGTMRIGDCEAASEALSPALDAEGLIPNSYRLEVSSPGIDRPLVRVSDFHRALGLEARIEMQLLAGGRKRFRGLLLGIEGEGAGLRLVLHRNDARENEPPDAILPLREIAEAKLVFNESLLRQSLRKGKIPGSGHASEGEEPAAGAPEAGAGSPPQQGPVARATSGSKPARLPGNAPARAEPPGATGPAAGARPGRGPHTKGDINGRKRK